MNKKIIENCITILFIYIVFLIIIITSDYFGIINIENINKIINENLIYIGILILCLIFDPKIIKEVIKKKKVK